MVIIIDNYDSFTYNLVQYFRELGEEVCVFRNDQISVGKVADMQPDRLVISPGPGDPSAAGISKDLIYSMHTKIPILGVCLGQQCIAEVFGGKVVSASRMMHGKTSLIYHQGEGIFQGIASPFEAARYHSLIVQKPLPEILICTAFTDEGEIMGLQHRNSPVFGVQFHPESILTTVGRQILKNFLNSSGS